MFSIKFDVQRSTTIEQPLDTVFAAIADFATWRHWSPWLCQEPDCPVEITGAPGQTGHAQSWNGKQIGSGNMHITQITGKQRLDYDLFFIKPWKSLAKVHFAFDANGNTCKVTWAMQGTLPIFLFFMKKMMSAMVGCDYERGLNMLKEYCETGEVLSQVVINNIIERPQFWYIGLKETCATAEIGPSMESAFATLQKESADGKVPEPDFTFSFYHNYDMVNQRCEYTSGYGYLQRPSAVPPNDFEQGEIEPHRALSVNHLGPYHHLGNAWSTIMGCQRHRKLKVFKAIPMYEIYESTPGEVDEKEIRTAIYLPVK